MRKVNARIKIFYWVTYIPYIHWGVNKVSVKVEKRRIPLSKLQQAHFVLLFNNNMLTTYEYEYLCNKFLNIDFGYFLNDYGYEINERWQKK